MRAAVIRQHGAPEVFEWQEVPDPEAGSADVLIRTHAVGINFADLLARMGLYAGAPKPPFVPGLELAGTVESDPSSTFSPGTRVAALSKFEAYAERIALPAAQAFRIPDAMSFEDAAAIPVNYLTAYHSMFRMGNAQAGDRILIHGAAGGVGVAVVQLARAHKMTIFGTAGSSKQDLLRQMGVNHPIDYTREDFEAVVRSIAPDGIEMVLDPIGGKSFAKSYRCLGPTGRLVVYGFSAAAGPSGKRSVLRGTKAYLESPRFHPLKLISDNITVIGVQLGRLGGRGHILRAQLEEIFRLYEAGQVKPLIGKTFPLREAAEAHRYIHNRKNIGKVLLKAV